MVTKGDMGFQRKGFVVEKLSSVAIIEKCAKRARILSSRN
jgi:hypothetical protein